MGIKTLGKKIKLGRIRRIKSAPRWADIRKFGLKRARSKRISVTKVKKWRRGRIRI